MSQHVVLRPVVTQEKYLRAACRVLGFDSPELGSQYIADKARDVRGLVVRFPGTSKLALFDLGGGNPNEAAEYIKDLGGRVGEPVDTTKLKTQYGIEAVKGIATEHGLSWTETTEDGDCILTVEVVS